MIQHDSEHYFHIYRHWGWEREYNRTVHKLFIDFKKTYKSVRRDVLYSILNEFGIPMKLLKAN